MEWAIIGEFLQAWHEPWLELTNHEPRRKMDGTPNGSEIMLVKFWGVRGSTPTPQAENLRYGGNTSCVEVRVHGRSYVFDCGTGFRVLGNHWKSQGTPELAHLFVSHFHWDHI